MSAPNLDRMVLDHGSNAVEQATADVREAARRYAERLDELKRVIGYAELQHALDGEDLPEPVPADIPSIARRNGGV